MKSFLEEYGITTVVAVVIFALIGTSVFFRDTGGDSLKGFMNNYQVKAELIDETPSGPVIMTKSYGYPSLGTITYEDGMTWREWLNSSYGSEYHYWSGGIFPKNDTNFGIRINGLDSQITGHESVDTSHHSGGAN